MKKKIVAAALACVLCVGLGIGGTLAWLTDKTDAVTNTFTVGDINIELKEHVYDATAKELTDATTITGNSNYEFVPGDTLPKDPFVTVLKDSEACYLFIKATETNNTCTGLDGKIISWQVDTSVWTALKVNGEVVPNVWFKKLDATTADTDYSILVKNQVIVNENITKVMVDKTIEANQPSLSFQAFAVQAAHVDDEAAAWAKVTQ